MEEGGPQIGEVTCGGSPHQSCKRDQRDMKHDSFSPPWKVRILHQKFN